MADPRRSRGTAIPRGVRGGSGPGHEDRRSVAVPTCTRHGAGEEQLAGVPARRHAAHSDHGELGQGDVDIVDRAHGDRMDRRPRQAAAAGAQHRHPRRRVVGQPEQRVDAGHRLGAGLADRARDVDDAVGVGAQLGPAGPAARGGRGQHGRRQLRIVGEDRVAPLEVGAGEVDLDRDDLARRRDQELGGAAVLVDRSAPDAGDDRRAGADQLRHRVLEPMGDAGALQADRVEHAHRCRGAAAAPGCPATRTRRAT